MAPIYDRLGVEYFGPIGARLVEIAGVGPGERVLDVGCGRGASLFPAAAAVGNSGWVVGIDIAPAMVAATAVDARRSGLRQVSVRLMDGQRPLFPAGGFDCVLGSMSIHMFPHLAAALAEYRLLLRPGGRLAVSAPAMDVSDEPRVFGLRSIAMMVDKYGGASGIYPDAEAFGGLARFRHLLAAVGFGDVSATLETVTLTAESGRRLVEWTWSHGMRDLWLRVPEERRESIAASIDREVESHRCGASPITLATPLRYVVATV